MSKKTVIFDADKERFLKYGIRALVQMEEMMGRPITDLGNEEQGISMKDMVIIIHCGLLWAEKGLSFEETEDIIDAAVDKHGFEYVTETMGKALSQAFAGSSVTP